MSFLARIWRSFRGQSHFVGRDLQGNRFYEYPSTSNDPRRTKRVVEYVGLSIQDASDAAMRARSLPVQWVMWLSHTRGRPPSIEELAADVARRERILANVALIEQREHERKARLSLQGSQGAEQIPAPTSEPATASDQPVSQPDKDAFKSASTAPQETIQERQHEPTPVYTDEPQAWTPRALRRGG